MSFFREISEKVKKKGSYTLVNYGGNALYIEGVKKIIDVTDSVMEFALKEGTLLVEGTGLYLIDIEDGTLIIKGEVEKSYVERTHNARNKGV